jgi:hypothetical protein
MCEPNQYDFNITGPLFIIYAFGDLKSKIKVPFISHGENAGKREIDLTGMNLPIRIQVVLLI